MKPVVLLSAAWLVVHGMMASSPASAADRPSNERATPGTVVPGTGTTAVQDPPDRSRTPPPGPRDTVVPGAAIVGQGDSAACAALRKQYAQSQACFARYRLANGGLKPQAFKQCREIQNPAVKCGSAVAD